MTEFPDLLETKEKLVVATQGVLKFEVGQTSGWIRPKIAYTTLMIMIMMILTTLRMMMMFAPKAFDTSISWPAGQDKSSVSNSQATSSMAENTGGVTSAPLIRSYYLTVLYLEG